MAPSTNDPRQAWRSLAACRSVSQEMVPDESDGAAVLLAKKVCQDCPVAVACLYAAEQIVERLGSGQAQGVWGGLTARERDSAVGLARWPAPCTSCRLDCVPINASITECSACRPQATVLYADYREQILELIAKGLSYEEISGRVRLPRPAVTRACNNWKVKPAKRSGVGHREYQPCGTVAAKLRHHRAEKKTGNPADGFAACPVCRHVSWKGGTKTPKK